MFSFRSVVWESVTLRKQSIRKVGRLSRARAADAGRMTKPALLRQ
jgi:hypothetical protein